MFEQKQVVMRFKNGEIKVEAMNFEGHECKEKTEVIEAALGTSTDIEYKSEWWALNGDSVSEFDDNLCG